MSTYLNADTAAADEISEVYATACSFECAETCNSGSWSSSQLALTLHTGSTIVILLHICVYRFTSITALYCHCTIAPSMLTQTVKFCPLELTYNFLQNRICNLKGKETTIGGGANKSLARPTSRCRRTESIVSLERGISSCAELQVFSCYRGWKEACQTTRAFSATSRRELSSRFFFSARQGAEGNWRHSDRSIRGTCTIVCCSFFPSRSG